MKAEPAAEQPVEGSDKNKPPLHDSGYKKLFSNHTIFRQCLETFVQEAWVQEIDFSDCETVEKSFISDEYRKRESDLLYKVRWRGHEAYLYVLFEFQSTVDRFMIVRVIYYIASFYLKYVQEHEGIEKLPALFPLVMYNGEDKWTAVTDFNELVDGAADLGNYGLRCQYFKLDIGQFTVKQLLAISNIVSTLFLAESNYNLELIIEELAQLFEQESDRQAVTLLINWFRQWMKYGKIISEDFAQIEQVYLSSQEVKTMLAKSFEENRQVVLNQGIEIGTQKGIEIGTQKGIELGKQEGIELGKQEGIELGKQEGIELGKQEGIELGIEARNRQIVHAMVTNGFTHEAVAEMLQLSLQEVERLLREPIIPLIQPVHQPVSQPITQPIATGHKQAGDHEEVVDKNEF